MSRDEDLNHFKRVFPVCLLKNCLALATYAHSKFWGTNSWYPLLSFVLVAWHHPVSHTILCTDCMVSAIADAARLQARASWSWTSKIKHWRISHGFPNFNLQGETKALATVAICCYCLSGWADCSSNPPFRANDAPTWASAVFGIMAWKNKEAQKFGPSQPQNHGFLDFNHFEPFTTSMCQ